jgi:hypothetical protein
MKLFLKNDPENDKLIKNKDGLFKEQPIFYKKDEVCDT